MMHQELAMAFIHNFAIGRQSFSMKKLLFIFLILSITVDGLAQAQKKLMSKQEYIALHRDDAIRDMIRTKVPASITLGQGMLESEWGNSKLAKNANNHFGIKCHNGWKGATYMMDDDAKNECFRKYKTVLDSYNDHSDFLKSRSHYAALFELQLTDYKGWAEGLKKAGYATSPTYAKDLIKIIEDNKLYELDKMGAPPTKEEKVIAKEKPIEKTTPPVKENLQTIAVTRQIKLNNDVKYVVAAKGETYYRLAKLYNMNVGQLFKYNEVEKDAMLSPGQVVYLQPKRRNGPVDCHTVKAGDTMYSISQQYAIRLKILYKKNRMKPGTEPKPGDILWLKATKKKIQ